MPSAWIEVIIVFWEEGVKEKSHPCSKDRGGVLLEMDGEVLYFGLAEGFLNFDCFFGKEFSHLICMK